ncbi:NAD(P)/FAD-dependent oxidoreductase [Actinocrispum wychmicini]|nr:FAD-dependent oxidoreductase [Actinocrispum wychmicini]
MRVVVVGSGVIGLLTAMECVLAGAEVSLVDADDIPSPSAMSHDRLRSIRALHPGDAELTRTAVRAHRAWLEVERRLGMQVHHHVGALTTLPVQHAQESVALLASVGVTADLLRPEVLAERYPTIRFPAGLAGVFDPTATVVAADQTMTALAEWLRGRPGVDMYPRSRVVAATAGGVRLVEGVVTGDRVVLAAGPWSRDLLPAALSARLTLHRQTVLSYSAQWEGMPVIPRFGTADGAWLIPPVNGAPACLSAAVTSREVSVLTDRTAPARWREHLVDRFGALLADFDPAAVTGAADGYYLSASPGSGPLLADLGDGVQAYAACGGMSFKFAPLVARALAARAVDHPLHPLQARC